MHADKAAIRMSEVCDETVRVVGFIAHGCYSLCNDCPFPIGFQWKRDHGIDTCSSFLYSVRIFRQAVHGRETTFTSVILLRSLRGVVHAEIRMHTSFGTGTSFCLDYIFGTSLVSALPYTLYRTQRCIP